MGLSVGTSQRRSCGWWATRWGRSSCWRRQGGCSRAILQPRRREGGGQLLLEQRCHRRWGTRRLLGWPACRHRRRRRRIRRRRRRGCGWCCSTPSSRREASRFCAERRRCYVPRTAWCGCDARCRAWWSNATAPPSLETRLSVPPPSPSSAPPRGPCTATPLSGTWRRRSSTHSVSARATAPLAAPSARPATPHPYLSPSPIPAAPVAPAAPAVQMLRALAQLARPGHREHGVPPLRRRRDASPPPLHRPAARPSRRGRHATCRPARPPPPPTSHRGAHPPLPPHRQRDQMVRYPHRTRLPPHHFLQPPGLASLLRRRAIVRQDLQAEQGRLPGRRCPHPLPLRPSPISRRHVPELLPDCFLFHLPAACTSPTYNWNALVDPTCHQACGLCGHSHHLGPCPGLAL